MRCPPTCKSKASMARRRSDRRTLLIVFTLLSMAAFATLFPVYAFLPSFSTQSHHPHHGKNGAAGKFEIAEDMFWKDGEPFQIIGGDLHYFRILPEYWEDRLLRAKALGLNTIQTYVPWNLHEPKPGQYAFRGIADLVSFLKLCKKLNLLVMLRAGPYICAEWDFGGFPAWLLAIEPAPRIRSSDSAYLQHVDKWWGILLPKLAPLLYSNGGPIIMVQIENEYGSYGDDKVYLRHLVKQARAMLGEDIILYTTDGGAQENLEKGTVGGDAVFSAVDFSTGDDPWPIFKLQKKFNAPGKSPPLSSEFYTGWLTHWGEKIQMTSAAITATFLEKILSKNGSAVLYMAHGGTNFGFYNGANAGDDRDYKPDITSYDYDAPIKESGDLDNEKFEAIRKVIQKYTSTLLPSVPDNNEKAAYGSVHLQKTSSLFELVNSMDSQHIVDSENPVPMESVGQMFGYLLYVSQYVSQNGGSTLVIPKVHDRAQVFVSCSSWVNGRSLSYIGTIERHSNQSLFLPNSKCVSHVSLYILVENMGHINYGQYMFDRKGILSPVYLDGRILRQWKMISIPLQNLNDAPMFNRIVEAASSKPHKVAAHLKLEYDRGLVYNGPAFYTGRFTVDKVRDTYISFRGWGKGVAFVNHFNIGRYWPALGPQCNLYVPAPILQDGENTLVLFELEAPNPELGVQFVDHSDFHCGLGSRNVSKL